MSKVGIIYWSSTGNTEAMAQAVEEGAKAAGADVEIMEVADADVDKALSFDVLALGCPAMGDEELEEGEFEPFFSDLEGKLSGKKVALFGSYDWGDGEWMRTWCGRAKDAGAELVDDEGLIVNNTPDDEGLAACRELGVVTSMGVDKGVIKIIGLAIANGLVTLSGCIFAQQQRYFDISMGTGTMVIGLASVIIGISLLKKVTFIRVTTSVVIGSIVYKACVAIAIRLGMPSSDLKLITAVLFLVILVLGMDRKKRKKVA